MRFGFYNYGKIFQNYNQQKILEHFKYLTVVIKMIVNHIKQKP